MSDSNEYEVQVISFESGEVVNRLEYRNKLIAEKGERGININLNQYKYFTVVVKLESYRHIS